jgi:hypothetical protein
MSDVYSAPLNPQSPTQRLFDLIAHRQTLSHGKFFSYTSSDLAFGAAYRHSRLHKLTSFQAVQAGYNSAVPSAITNQ